MNGPVCDLRECLVVGDDDEGLSELVAQVKEELVQFFLVLGVEGTGWFVGKDDGGVVDECPRYSHTLFFSSREFGGFVVDAVAEVEVVEQFLGTHFGLLFVFASDESRDADVFECGKLGQELVELEDETEMLVAKSGDVLVFQSCHVDAIDDDGAAVGCIEGTHDLEKGSLTRSRGTDDADHLALADVEVNAFEHLEGAEGFGDVVKLYHGFIYNFTIYNLPFIFFYFI